MAITSLERRRILGLDSIRFVSAVWVTMHHGARPGIATWFGLSRAAIDWNSIVFNGVAAVIVFFVISGLCVHYPYTRSEPLHLPSYYAQRFVRIGIPLFVVLTFAHFSGNLVGDDVATATRMVLWSLRCEAIYYAIYPLLRVVLRKISIGPLVIVSFIAAYSVIAGHWHWMLYADYPAYLAAIVAFPCWLLGCALAEIVAAGRLPVLSGSVWWWRGGLMILSIPSKAILYPSVWSFPIGNPATLDVLSVCVVLWLIREIQAFEVRPPPKVFEWGGKWSFSLYLVHRVVIISFRHVLWHINVVEIWLLQLVAITTAALAFYFIVERPAHFLARALAKQLATWRLSIYGTRKQSSMRPAETPGDQISLAPNSARSVSS